MKNTKKWRNINTRDKSKGYRDLSKIFYDIKGLVRTKKNNKPRDEKKPALSN